MLGDRIRVASLNMHSGRSADGVEDLAAIARTVAGFDVVGLQEVYDSPFPGTPVQVQTVAESLRREWVFGPSERRYWSERFGNGLIGVYPLGWQYRSLPSPQEGSRKSLLTAFYMRFDLSHFDPGVVILVTHITRGKDQDVQLRYVFDQFMEQSLPAVLMGDLNVTSKHPLLQELLSRPGVGNPLDERMPGNIGKHIDWILTRGMETRDAGIRDLGASDHPLVWADLAIAVPATQPTTTPATQP